MFTRYRFRSDFFRGWHKLCTACAVDAQCPNERPHCQLNYGLAKCVACITTAECVTGVCAEGSCTPGCGADKPCGATLECGPELRCGPLSCSDDSVCPVNMACNAGHCARKACSSDAMCQGACVSYLDLAASRRQAGRRRGGRPG